jgi:ketopantoate reductase
VTFLVRPRRAAQLAEHGLRVKSPHGDLHFPNPRWCCPSRSRSLMTWCC